jgi:hypothetical protein
MNVRFGFILLGIAVTGVSQGAGLPVPHLFQAGQRAVASEVNANFQNLADRIEAGGEVESNSNYVGTATAKTFVVTDISGGCTTFENHTFVSSNGGATITHTIIGRAGSGGAQCYRQIWIHQLDATGRRITQIDSFDASDNPTGTTTYSPGIFYLPAQVHKGKHWVLDTDTVFAPPVGSPTSGTYMGEITVVDKENITVPAGTYTNCLKVVRSAVSGPAFPLAPSFRIDWYCPGVGWAKVRDGSGITRTLNSVTP